MKYKYIDAEKLIAEIERRIIEHKKSLKKKDITLISEAILKGSLGAYESIERFILSLQQEQKPSEEQMSMLLSILNEPNSASSESARLMLESLYNDLKAL